MKIVKLLIQSLKSIHHNNVKVEVVQLWTGYLRKLRMGFEKDGNFAPADYNMFYRCF